MDLSKTVYAIVGVLVAVLIVATVAVPIIENAQMEQSTVFNNGTELNYHACLDDDFILSKDAGSNVVVVNGTSFSPLAYDNFILLTNVVAMRLASSGNVVITSSSGNVNIEPTEALTASIRGSSLIYNIDGVTTTVTGLGDGFVISDNGDYVTSNTFTASKTTYVNGIEDVSFALYTSSGDFVVMLQGEEYITGDTVLDITLDPVEGYVDLYTIPTNGISGGDGEASFSGAHVIVPYKIYAHNPEQGSNVALLGAALLMLFLVPLMMVVRMISGRRD